MVMLLSQHGETQHRDRLTYEQPFGIGDMLPNVIPHDYSAHDIDRDFDTDLSNIRLT